MTHSCRKLKYFMHRISRKDFLLLLFHAQVANYLGTIFYKKLFEGTLLSISEYLDIWNLEIV